MKICKDNSPLAAIVCGYERGGTTLVSELLRQHPNLDSGFEGGFLLSKDARSFISLEPFSSHLKAGWKVSHEDLEYICEAPTWPEVYKRLLMRSPVIQDKQNLIFDKTPRYMVALPSVLKKIPNVPCIVIVRDPRALFYSMFKREGVKSGLSPDDWIDKNLDRICSYYSSYANALKTAIKNGYKEQIFLIKYEILCLEKQTQTKKIFDFLNLEYKDSYLSFQPRYENVRESSVEKKYINEYKEHISPEICNKILQRLDAHKHLFFENR